MSAHSHEERQREADTRLRCEACGREADEQALGWRALHGNESDEDDIETFIFCPWCAAHHFGPS